MSTKRGITDNQIYPQPGFSANRDENGGWSGSAEFILTTATWNQSTFKARFARGVSITTLDPTIDPYFSFLKITSQSVVRNEGGLVTVRVDVTGGQSAQFSGPDLGEETPTTYRLEGRLQEALLTEHPKCKVLTDVEQVALGKLISGEYAYGPDPFTDPSSATNVTFIPGAEQIVILSPDPITTDDAKAFALRISKGQKTYLVPAIVWTESTQGTDPMTAAQLNKLGYIATPRGDPPNVTGSRNWMLTSASQEQRGELYQTQLEWTLSDREGFDDFIYDT